jgi:hypothetical protein
MAPGARLVFQAIEQPVQWSQSYIQHYVSQAGRLPRRYELFGVPDKFDVLLHDAYQQGARVHSLSWGEELAGYDSRCRELDQFVWDHKDYLVVAAAGNDGPGAKTVASPGAAKNALTVGACENDRPGQFSATYGEWWPVAFGGPPAKADGLADCADHLFRLSSRGPCHPSGRRKPDLVAPGTFVLSTRSSKIDPRYSGWATFPKGMMHYVYESGTSMSTALVAGAAVLVREYLRKVENVPAPSAALVKAILIHSAVFFPQHPAATATAPGPADDDQGWGRIDLDRVLRPAAPSRVQFIDQTHGLVAQYQRDLHSIAVVDDSVPLRATLVYSDLPGDYLINNLDLKAYPPGSRVPVIGNDFRGTRSTDTVNNVEGIVIEVPALGTWLVEVIAAAPPKYPPQPYALVISGGIR